jgi:hypothetical protein
MTGAHESGRDARGSVSRRQLMLLAGGSTAAALLVGCGDSGGNGETASFGDGDVGILNYVLTLEHVEAGLYAEILRSGLLGGAQLETLREFGREEREHVAALTDAVERLGGDPAEEPKTRFPLQGAQSALELAGRTEDLSAAAYLGQLPRVENAAALATMLSIHTVEGAHSTALNAMLGKPIASDGAFAKPATANAVLKAIEPFMAA